MPPPPTLRFVARHWEIAAARVGEFRQLGLKRRYVFPHQLRYLRRPGTVVDVVELSARLHTEVQFFATDRVTESHRWQRAVDGELVRTFGYVGRTGDVTSWHGDPDPAERSAGLPATFADAETTVLVSEKDLLRVADGWSLDPSGLDGRAAPGPLRVGAAD